MKSVKSDPEDPLTTLNILGRDVKGSVVPKQPAHIAANWIIQNLVPFQHLVDLGLTEIDFNLGALFIPIINDDGGGGQDTNRGLTIWWNASEILTPGGRCVETGNFQFVYTTQRQLRLAIRCGLRLMGVGVI